ncbi:MFS transporter [Gordonia hankookensis]|uniref:MFS transporter n=1 Tax=Gordonia hankookensis TaxID=589403 RepID=A0ABR7WEA3_9ACTN|nr:MFS transporter [Gordonia hankookensis]MBD1321110.1 MFS transporter [Gordonia hankookensis]
MHTAESPVKRFALPAILAVLFATGWGANHFASMIPVLKSDEGLATAVLDGAFGIYAIGLLPGLFGGGSLSDRVGRRPVVLTGAALAGIGNLMMIGWHDQAGVLVGRLVVGLGAGLTISAGTAWAADLRGRSGATLAGALLTTGFAIGPVITGLLAEFAPHPAELPFALSGIISLVMAAVGFVLTPTTPIRHDHPLTEVDDADGRSVAAALSWSVPMALWVFSSVTVAVVVMAHRISDRYDGPWVPGVAAALSLGSGVIVQFVVRRLGVGRMAGVVGAALAAIGFTLSAVAGGHPSMAFFVVTAVVLGLAYGLCLRDGLMDVEAFAPRRSRGAVTGIFYVACYLGFGLPVLLTTIEPSVGIVAPMIVLTIVAAAASAARAIRLQRTA